MLFLFFLILFLFVNLIPKFETQVMLYVDGMNGVMKHEPTMQWLYSLIASNYRSVVKTALKLLLVFVEYAESNCHVLVSAIHAVDKQQGTLPWSNIMRWVLIVVFNFIFVFIISIKKVLIL